MATPKTEPDGKKTHGIKWILRLLVDHTIVTLIVCSFVFAFIVHWLFSTPAPNEWWVHKWEAGDVLTFE